MHDDGFITVTVSYVETVEIIIIIPAFLRQVRSIFAVIRSSLTLGEGSERVVYIM